MFSAIIRTMNPLFQTNKAKRFFIFLILCIKYWWYLYYFIHYTNPLSKWSNFLIKIFLYFFFILLKFKIKTLNYFLKFFVFNLHLINYRFDVEIILRHLILQIDLHLLKLIIKILLHLWQSLTLKNLLLLCWFIKKII
jgi:hypothetical protein